MKKLFFFFFALLVANSAMADAVKIGDLYYNLNTSKQTAEVTYPNTGYGSDYRLKSVVIPETIAYKGVDYSVTSIRGNAFAGSTDLTILIIPNSVTTIGDLAFYYCTSLTSATISNNLTTIGEHAFWYCSKLKSVIIPSSVTSMKDNAFEKCSSLTSVVWNAKNCKDFSSAPFVTSSITSFTFGDGVEYIPDYLCGGMKFNSIIIPNSVTSIGNSVFEGCTKLTSITIPNSVTQIKSDVFTGCESLTSVDLPNSITTIGCHFFQDCSSLTSITLPNSITSIQQHAFRGCSSLSSITIPENVTSIGYYAFEGCAKLSSVVWNAKKCTDFLSIDYSPFFTYSTVSQITTFTFGDNVEHIPSYLCCNMKNLASITIPNNVTSIGKSVFQNSTSLTSITWNAKNCTNFTSFPFYEICSQITSFNFGKNVEFIPSYLCYDMNKLTSITSQSDIPPTIGNDAFYNVSKSTPVYIPCNSLSAYNKANGWNSFTDIQESLIKHSIVVSSKDKAMGTAQIDFNTCEETQISATANYSYRFIQWSDGNTENPRSLVLIQDTILSAEFTIATYTITANVNGNGVVTGAGTYNHGTTAILTAVADNHYHFVKWSDGNNDNPRSITVMEDVTFTAEFAIDTHKIVVDAGENGVAIGTGTYDYGKTITITAIANSHCHFVRWSDGSTDNPRSYVVTKDATITAEFAIDTHNVIVSDTENGTVIGAGTYKYGETVTLNAIPNEGYHFVKWSNGYSQKTLTFIITEDVTLGAEFSINTYKIVATANNGTVTGSGTYTHGDSVTITATPSNGYHFVRWSNGGIKNPLTFIATENLTLKAEISPNTYEIITSAENGTIIGAGTYKYGDVATLIAVANDHYHFVRWADGSTDNPRVITVTQDLTLSAEFAIDTHKVTVNADENGSAIGSGTYNYGETITLTATPYAHYHFSKWSDGNTDNPRSYVVTNDITFTAEFAIDTHDIVVSGCNNGTVAGAGTYKYGDIATLTAIANSHYHFVRWADGSIDNPRVITVTQDMTLSAEFAIDTHKVTVNANENGNAKGSGVYNYGETITLVATANTHYHFVRWSDGSTDNPRSYVVTNDATLTAEFAIDTHNIVVSGYENGTVTGAGTYKYGDVATLTAVANDHYHFVRWSDGSIDNPRVITVTQDLTLSAEFAIDTHKITINADKNGSAIGSGTYNYGETITLTATPNAHYHFSKWSDGNTDNPRSYVVTNDVMLTAEFAIDTHNIVVRGCENGTVTGAGTYNYGDIVTLAITPNEGYKFVKWSDGDTNNPRSIIVTEDVILGGELELLTYVVSVSCDETHGTVSGSGTYKHGETIVLTATANNGYKFAQWNDGNINAQRTLIVTSDMTLVATFEEIQCKLTLVVNDPIMGSVFGDGMYKYGTEVSINATPNTGYQFVKWSDNNFSEQRTLIITTDISLTAYFQAMTYIITAIANDEKLGTVYGGGEYAYNTSVSLMAVANDGAEFVTWTNGVVENPYIFKAVKNMAIQAIFKAIPSGVDDIQVEGNTTTKFLQNGQLFIVRDGKTYTVMGQEVK